MLQVREHLDRVEREAQRLWRDLQAKALTHDTSWDQLDWRTRNQFRDRAEISLRSQPAIAA